MSLNWSIKDVENMETVCFNDWDSEKKSGDMKSETEQLIHLTMVVGIPNITEDSYKKFYSRLKLYEDLFGYFICIKNEETGHFKSALTEDVIKNHIGLSTNATSLTMRKFMKNVKDRWEREIGEL